MKQFTYTIKDELGVHARPAGLLVKLAKKYASKVTIEKDGKTCDMRKLMAVMGLGIKQGETIYNGNQTSFANERVTNTFEVSGTFNREQLQLIFAAHSIKIEDAGTTTVVTVNKEISNAIFLETLLSNKISISYFRDISTSTRKLFHKDI